MNITINGSRVSRSMGHAENLEEVLLDLSDHTIPRNQLVGSVMVNGNEFSEIFPGQAREISSVHINDLAITTVSLEQFAKAAIQDSVKFISDIIASVTEAAELFRMFDETEANEKMSRIIDPLRALVSFISSMRNDLKWDFDNEYVNGHSLSEQWDKMNSVIDELKSTQEEGDWILYADLLEYELIPVLNAWMAIFNQKSEAYNA